MRKEFAEWCENHLQEKKHLFLTGDLGFMALENVRDSLNERFINMGVAEQNMMGVAAGLASVGFVPLCYSIASFAVYRPAEQIRLDICLHERNVKIVGNGGGYGYGIMGATHHALEDYGLLSTFHSMKCFIPFANSEVESACEKMYEYQGPSYLRLGYGILTEAHQFRFNLKQSYMPLQKLSSGNDLTIVFVGSVGINVLEAICELESVEQSSLSCAVYALKELPLCSFSDEFLEDLKRSKKLLVVEEHVARAGVGEYLAHYLLRTNMNVIFSHLNALGYPSKTYGRQSFHQKQSGLDKDNIKKTIIEML
ncbi:MAG: hypothetical protein KBD76_05105 [Bacteriovorax sp.]|nr:hypothetical protein [Bacteriovorax sp.]